MITASEIRDKLIKGGLKITPQRIAVFEAVVTLNNHPTAENIIDQVRIKYLNISVGTIYKTLETFVQMGLIKKVNTDKGISRFDAVIEPHHHIHYTDSNIIEDYYDDELTTLVENYFRDKRNLKFKIEEVNLQIIGKKLKAN